MAIKHWRLFYKMSKYLVINPNDDVAIALRELKKGEVLDGIRLLQNIPQAHKFALHDMEKGHAVIKYGHVIGTLTHNVKKGEWIHTHNLRTTLDEEREYSFEKANKESLKASERTFQGFKRLDGRVGIRNDIYIIPLVGCINNICMMIKRKFVKEHPDFNDRVKVLTHPYGCSQLGDDKSNTRDTLIGLAKNPNAGGVLIVSLGCEENRLDTFIKHFGNYDQSRFYSFICQESKDEIAQGIELMNKLFDVVSKDKRTTCHLSDLVLGLKCGGSDGFSGITANPLVGTISDTIGASKGKVLLSEVPEMFGAEQQLMNRAKDKIVFKKVVNLIDNFKAYYVKNNQPCYENPSPGNKAGGISTLEEKSLGCVLKAGRLEVRDVLNPGEISESDGLSLVNGPGNDIVASTNIASCGANLLLFTTGRGTPFSSVIPTVKIATNHILATAKKRWIDYDAERVFDLGWEKAHEELLDYIIDVCSGQLTAAEKLGDGEIGIFKSGVTL